MTSTAPFKLSSTTSSWGEAPDSGAHRRGEIVVDRLPIDDWRRPILNSVETVECPVVQPLLIYGKPAQQVMPCEVIAP